MGEVIGGAMGGLFGTFANLGLGMANLSAQKKARKERQKAGKAALDEANTTYDQMEALLRQYRDGQTSLSDPDMVDDLKELIQNYEGNDYDFDKFGYDKSVEDFVNPYYDQIIDATANKLQHTAAGAAMGRGTGAALNIAEGVAQKNDDLYKTALSQYNTDRAQSYQEYNDYIRNMQNRMNNLNQNMQTKINLMSGALQHDEAQESDYMSDLLGIMGDRTKTNVEGTIAAYA